jgi:hypothetical protein
MRRRSGAGSGDGASREGGEPAVGCESENALAKVILGGIGISHLRVPVIGFMLTGTR